MPGEERVFIRREICLSQRSQGIWKIGADQVSGFGGSDRRSIDLSKHNSSKMIKMEVKYE